MGYYYGEDDGRYERPRRKHHIFLPVIVVAAMSILLLVCFLFLSSGTSFPSGQGDGDGPGTAQSGSLELSEGTVSGSTLRTLKKMEEKEPRLRPVVEDPQRYPAQLLESLSYNPELLNFTLDYPKKKGTWQKQISLSGTYGPGRIPLFLQWDERWGYAPYGNGIVGLDGCGPTCLSMVAVGLTGNTAWNPEAVARFSETNGYLDEKSDSTLWTLMSEGAEKLGLHSSRLPLSESRMAEELSEGHPIICSMGPGDFTTEGHFIVLSGYQDGSFTVRDPNSRLRSGERWRYQTLKTQIRNLWAFSA